MDDTLSAARTIAGVALLAAGVTAMVQGVGRTAADLAVVGHGTPHLVVWGLIVLSLVMIAAGTATVAAARRVVARWGGGRLSAGASSSPHRAVPPPR